MTLHPDPSWRDEWCLDCDGCGDHIHAGMKDSKLADPRMSERFSGWKLDIAGKDYCPDCKENHA